MRIDVKASKSAAAETGADAGSGSTTFITGAVCKAVKNESLRDGHYKNDARYKKPYPNPNHPNV